MIVPEAPLSAVAPATALSFVFQGGSSAVAPQGGSPIFMHIGDPNDHGIFEPHRSAQSFVR
jgi:hypothetical protein